MQKNPPQRSVINSQALGKNAQYFDHLPKF
jgi:hypothetical protein